ncbi:beta-taxilin [Centropristis striata]|uniref:beta-taxilin n=1 Tax=Centropristis striata TaxID=184440 RepID=UPI0027DF7865|nr:beta-taxilin [Centropristis striata]
METSLKAAEVLTPPQADMDPESPAGEAAAPPAASSSSSSDSIDSMEEFRKRLDDIISDHGSAAALLERQTLMEMETENMTKEPRDDIPVAMETEICLIMKTLNKLSSPQQKLEDVVRKYAELGVQRRSDEKKLNVLQQRLSVLLEERLQLQEESRCSIAARSKLENLCRELQGHYNALTERTMQRCREDEEKRKDMTDHFQAMLTEIQAQIEQHSSRNDKLCLENSNLTGKLESLMNQCEMREESLEKLNKHRELQYKLTEAKLQQANAQLTEAEERHKREKEYLLREAIEKTKKCFAMKEQELAMKKKLTLYGQKFDEFQTTLAKSNEIYVRFKNEMDNMNDKMKKMEKESNLWKTRFETCNKALTTMIEERTEKSKEFEVFVLKIHKLEKLCNALQEERAILYGKIKDVRKANSDIPSKVFGSSEVQETPDSEAADKSALLTPEELQELQDIQVGDQVLTDNMSRLKDEQAKLQEFADSLFAVPKDRDEEQSEDSKPEEDLMSSAFVQFKTQAKEEAEPVPEQVVDQSESVQPQPEKVEEVPKPATSTPVENPSETIPTDTKPEAVKAPTQVEEKEVQQVKPEEEIQPKPAESEPTPKLEEVKINPPTELKPEAAEAEIVVQPVVPVEAEKVQAEPVQAPATSSEKTPQTSSSSNGESSKKQTPKKKKKRNGKNAS